MNPTSWSFAIIIMLVLAGFAGIQGCIADEIGVQTGEPSPPITPPDAGIAKPTVSPTIKTTIAPIHTKEPIVKPPVDQPSATPTLTQVPDLPVIRQTPTTLRPTSTPSPTGPETDINETASIFFQRGLAFEEAGNFQAALDEYSNAIAKEPYFTDAWYHKAITYEKLAQWDDAYQAYRFLLTIDPGYPAALNLSGLEQNTSGSNNRPIPPQTEQISLLLIAALISMAGFFAAGLFLYHKRNNKGDASPVEMLRTNKTSQNPFPDIDGLAGKVCPYYSGNQEVLRAVIRLAIEIAREGREGKHIGTAFLLGDSNAVLERSRQLILNPLAGHSEKERLIINHDMRENIKELALVDGAFVIRDDGIVEAAGRYISIDTSNVRLPKGFGTRHVSVAAITQETGAIGIVVSESGGLVRIFAKGKVIAETK